MKTWIHKDGLHPVTLKTCRAQNSVPHDSYEQGAFCCDPSRPSRSESPVEEFQLLAAEVT
jgi:hypothetical protein